MSVVYLHGLGQTPAGWESGLRVLGQESGGLCPDLFGLIRGKEVCYENLYQAFSRYCGALPAQGPCQRYFLYIYCTSPPMKMQSALP